MAILADKGLLQKRAGRSEVFQMLALTLTRRALRGWFFCKGNEYKGKTHTHTARPTNYPPHTTHKPHHGQHIICTCPTPHPHHTHTTPMPYALCDTHTHVRAHTPYAAYTPHSASIVMHTQLYNVNHGNGYCGLGTHRARHCSKNFT